ncbi:hypothetical protein CBS101457_002946 [Exobasidium rhododendri]|nr:hypothetical protein CBS101457_002946 [Exobasidium rhododendri]
MVASSSCRTLLSFVLFLLLLWGTDAAPWTADKRGTADFIAPTGYKVSWNVASKRASVGASDGGLGYSSLATSGGITQALITQCALLCTQKPTCGFYQLFQVASSSYGTVDCSLHSVYVASSKATYATGPDSTGGTIVTTYGVRNLNTPVSGSSTIATSAISTTTISSAGTVTTSTASATATLPASPPSATLTQFKPCSSVTSNTVPMFVNSQFAKSASTSAYIVQHGSGRDFQDYFTAVYNVIGTTGIIAAPNFYINTDAIAPTTWYQPSVNLAWANGTGTWAVGADAVAPSAVSCSTMDTYDALLTYLNNKSLFPNLAKVYFVGHSAGANLVSRYSQLYNGNYPFAIRYIVANAASQAYFTGARPVANPCSDGTVYSFQLVSTGMPRYVAAKFTSASAIFQRWITRDVVSLVGDLDTNDRFPGGVEDCASQAQGGVNRRERNYAWWAYTNILAATGANVSSYTGYQQLLASGAKTLYKGTFSHQNCVVDGVGHDEVAMFSSACGTAAMTKTAIPAGVGAQYP